ncbi:MAG: hypothetical protein ACO3JF_02255 [Ilumatobacteraceae bacterium]
MEQEQTQRELLDDLVVRGVISEQQADNIANAPRWTFGIRELVTYLASLIIAVGVIRILALAFKDASVGVIATALYVAAAVAGVASWKLSSGSEIRKRFAEVLELGALVAAAGATGIVLDQADIRGEWIGFILSSVGAAWGLWRCSFTRFAGTIVMSIGVMATAIALEEIINPDSQISGGLFILVAGVLVTSMGLRDIGARQLARAIGSLYVIIGSMNIASAEDWLRPTPIATGAVLFAIGALLLAPEMLMAGAFCIVAGIIMTTVEWISNEMAQGLVIIATGLVVLGALTIQMKRAVNRPKPDARVA